MKKAFLSISYKNKDLLKKEINYIIDTLKEFSIEVIIFVQKYQFKEDKEKDMMNKAFEEIRDSDVLIAEVSDKAIGVGIEIGYAKALNKPVIYLRNAFTEYSTTVGGSSSYKIVYNGLIDLKEKLYNIISKFIAS